MTTAILTNKIFDAFTALPSEAAGACAPLSLQHYYQREEDHPDIIGAFMSDS